MHKNCQDIKSSNGGKENVELLTNERSQILYSNYSEQTYCGSLKEEKMNSKLVTGIEETETKIFEKLKSTVLLQMGLQDSDKKVNDKITIVLKDTNGIKPSERMEDCSKYKSIGSIQSTANIQSCKVT